MLNVEVNTENIASIRRIALDPAGGGYALGAAPIPFLVAFTPDGRERFAVTTDPLGIALDLAIDAANRAITLTADGPLHKDVQTRIRRYRPDGVIDESFGDGGSVVLEPDLPDAGGLRYEPGIERVVVCARQRDPVGVRCGRFWL